MFTAPLIFYEKINSLFINSCCSAANIVHPTNPLHLIFRFEFLGNTPMLCHLLYGTRKHILGLFVKI